MLTSERRCSSAILKKRAREMCGCAMWLRMDGGETSETIARKGKVMLNNPAPDYMTTHVMLREPFPGPGEGAALETAMLAARPRLLRLARLRGVPDDQAEDVVQETLLEAWRCQDRLYDPTGAGRWLDEICRNVCRRFARVHATEQRHMLLPPAPTDDESERNSSASLLLDAIPDGDGDDPLEALTRQDMALLLNRALGLLPAGARELVELCYLRETSQREATDRLGISLSALEARLHRARRQLRTLFNGPLRGEAEAFGLALDEASAEGWRETRLWCALCGRRLSGMFITQPDGGVNLHISCPECERRYGLCDNDGSSVHSKGMIALARLSSFRPAWKRTMQGTARRFTQALQQPRAGTIRCLYCGAPATIELVDKAQIDAPPGGLARHPYQFWAWWRCQRDPGEHSDLFAASDLVYWSSPEAQRFMREHPRWLSAPELLVEHAGRAALRLQMADATSAARLTLLADRRTLATLAVY